MTKKTLAVTLIISLSMFFSCTTVQMKLPSTNNGKHKGWYKNTNNPHHPNTTNPGHTKSKAVNGKSNGKGKN